MLAQRQSRFWLLTFTCLLVFSAIASAQDRPKGELFLGFSGRSGGDPILPGWNASAAVHLNEQLAIVADFSGHYCSQKPLYFGLFAPGSGTNSTGLGGQAISPPCYSPGDTNSLPLMLAFASNGYSVYSFLVGPQYSHHLTGRTRIFVRALFGASQISADTGYYGSAQFQTLSGFLLGGQTALALPTSTQTGFSFGAGGGLDVSVAKHWGVRVFQADYLNEPSVLGGGRNDFRLSSGLIYQW